MNASQATIDQAVGKITTGMGQLGKNVGTSQTVIGVTVTTTTESISKIVQTSIEEEKKKNH